MPEVIKAFMWLGCIVLVFSIVAVVAVFAER